MGRLFLRVFLWFWLGSTCLVLVLGVTLAMAEPDVVATWRFIGRTAMRHLGSQAANAYERHGGAAAEALIAGAAREGRFRVWLYAADGRQLAGPAPAEGAAQAFDRALGDGDDAWRLVAEDPWLLSRRTSSDSGAEYVVMWEAPRLRGRSVSPFRFPVRLAALILTGGVVCAVLVWQFTKPIRTLRSAARQFAAGDLSVRVGGHRELQRGDELSELAREFDQMASRIQELLTSQQRLLADISHELRSPLARLSLALDLARRRLGDEIPEHDRIGREVHRLNELIGQLLALARLESHAAERAGPIELGDLVREVARDAGFEASATRRTVVVTPAAEVTLKGSRPLLRSAIENVVRNALRHTPEGSEVSIAMEPDQRGQRVAVIVRDHGPGVPPWALDRLFDPFFRVDEARDRVSGGVGLGLAITRQAMMAHGGTATASNHPDGGLVVRLELPLDARA